VPQPTPQATPSQVPQLVPQPTPQATPQAVPTPVPQPTPQATPSQVPQLVPQPTPQATPQAVPTPVPQRTPQATPSPVPQLVPQPIPQAQLQAPVPAIDAARVANVGSGVIAIPRPIPRIPGAAVADMTVGNTIPSVIPERPAWTIGFVAASPGRQALNRLPTFRGPDGALVQCLAGGFGWRYATTAAGTVRLVGRLPILRTTSAIVRDVPANQIMSAECVVIVDRRFDE
jgi:hypothetical protein